MEHNTEKQKVGLVVFGFGEPSDLESNRQLADFANKVFHSTEPMAIFTDRDVASHLSKDLVTIKILNQSLFPHTYRMAVFAIEQAKEEEIDELYVVAMPCHIWRCLRDLRWVANEQEVIIKLIPQPLKNNFYPKTATTWYTRSAWVWWPMEMMYRMGSGLLPSLYKHFRS